MICVSRIEVAAHNMDDHGESILWEAGERMKSTALPDKANPHKRTPHAHLMLPHAPARAVSERSSACAPHVHRLCILQARAWSVFMTMVILYSILNFTIAAVPAGLSYIDVWTNISTSQVKEFSLEEDFTGDGDGMYRSESVRQASNMQNDYRVPYREIEVFCIATFTFEFILRLVTCCAGPGLTAFLKAPSNVIDLVGFAPSPLVPLAAQTSSISPALFEIYLCCTRTQRPVKHPALTCLPPAASLSTPSHVSRTPLTSSSRSLLPLTS